MSQTTVARRKTKTVSEPLRAAAKPVAAEKPAEDDVESRIYRAVLESVLSRRLKPGTKLPEAGLCELFGTSRSVVRRVLQRLARDHVVELQLNRGGRVAMPSPEEARQVFEARRALESALVALVAQRATPDDLKQLRQHLQTEHSAMHITDEGPWARMAASFHLRLARLARSPILEGYLVETMSRFSLIVAVYEPPDNRSCEHDEHERIVDCIERGDPSGAMQLMDAHLRELESSIIVKRNPPDSSLAHLLGLA